MGKNEKEYLDDNVYQRAKKRIVHIINSFDKIFVCFSGGKDSLTVLHLVEEVYKEKFSLFNRSRFEDEPFKDVLQNETIFAEKLKTVDRRVRNSYHENNRTFVDDGISDEYILEFISDGNDKDKIKSDIVIKVLKDWASKANIAGKQIKIID
jgi:3'-phosphoadenosine 5'-phosphosulfate sulfotransferase (PAPS reductase)/FAD synthetase